VREARQGSPKTLKEVSNAFPDNWHDARARSRGVRRFRHATGSGSALMEDEAIRTLVTRLARAHPSGGEVIERAAILAVGADSAAILAWITDHDGYPEPLAPVTPGRGRGLHSARLNGTDGAASTTPRRYVLPAGALT
jgi:hypothetical protein